MFNHPVLLEMDGKYKRRKDHGLEWPETDLWLLSFGCRSGRGETPGFDVLFFCFFVLEEAFFPRRQQLKKDTPKHEMDEKAPNKVQQTTSYRIL
jgi:hypothetical protein